MTMDLSEFFKVFYEEAEELLADMERLLLGLDVEAPDDEQLNAIFRAAHSIKGGASTFGMQEITEVTHVLESLLDKIRKHELALTREHVDSFLLAQDVLHAMIEARRADTQADPARAAEVMQRLTELAQAAGGQAAGGQAAGGQAAGGQPAAEKATVPQASVPAPVAAAAESRHDKPAAVAEDQDAHSPAAEEHARAAEASARNARDAEAVVSKLIADNSFGLFDTPESTPSAAPADAATSGAASSSGSTSNSPSAPGSPAGPAAAASNAGSSTAQTAASMSKAGAATSATEVRPAAQDAGTNAVAASNTAAGSGSGPAQTASAATAASAAAAATSAAAAATATAATTAAAANKAAGDSAAGNRAAEKPRANSESSTIRVGVEKVDELINMVGELVITHAMIEQLSTELDPMLHERLLNSVAQLARNTRELQESVLGIRMLPMDLVFSRFPRMVRDLASKLGKKIELITIGAATELDKSLTERLIDPLTHLIRNSIDHGIEMPAVRKAAGKTETGRLTLSAAHQGGSIIIEVSDDGAGLNRERILAKARQQGIPVFDAMSDEEVWALIFAPGFSTAEVVTDVSGRGVGMDVVKRNITSMGGSVEIKSAKGFGSSIRIALPLTLAILEGMSVKVGDEIYILGLSSVVESLQPAPGAVKDVMGQGAVIKVRDEYLPIVPLHRTFGGTPRFTNPADAIVVILEAEGRKVGLMVDELVGQQQVVVKSLETNYRRVTGISGATILGDGSVALILDVPTLIRHSRQASFNALPA